MKFRTMVFAVAGVLGWAGVAQAQPADADPYGPATPPAAPPAAPAPAAAPPADQPAPPPADQPPPPPTPPTDAAPPPPPAAPPPAALPAVAPPPAPILSFGGPTPPPVDSVEQPAEVWKKPNPFTYSWLTWTQSASPKIFGVGRDYISTDDEVYSWDFTLTPRYAFVNTQQDTVYVNASVGVNLELTNCDTCQLYREWLWKDTQVGVGWAHVVYESKDGEWKSTPGISLSALLPTSKASGDEGKYFQGGVGLSDRSIVKLRGSKKDWFPNALVIVGANYSHLFARSYDPTAASPFRERQDAFGANTDSDQLSMSSFNQDQLKFSLIYYLTIWKDLSFGNAWGLTVPFKHQFTPTPTDTCIATGCIAVANNPTATTGVPITNFDVSLSYDFLGLGRLDVGYNNETPEIDAGGNVKFSNVFYNAETAQFYVDVVAYLDGIYDKTAEKLKKNKASAQRTPHPGINY
jgi:hypothetical protein